MVSPKPGRLDVFCLGENNEIYHRIRNGQTWEPPEEWTSLGGSFISASIAFSTAPGMVDVFCMATNYEMFYLNLEVREWKSLGNVV
jgi:hypothetical protein